jgi:protein TonB
VGKELLTSKNPNAMKPKKSKQANLENYRSIFLQIGIILALTAILASFEWKSKVNFKPLGLNNSGVDIIEVDIPITKPEAEIPKKIDLPSFELKLIDDVVGIEDIDLDKFISEIGEEDPIKIIEFEEPEEVVDPPIYYKVEVYPKFMGKDDNAFRKYIIENVKFPIEAQETGLTGKVQVQFVVDLDGSLSQIKILRGVHPSIDNEVLRVIENSPKWEPAIQAGKYVRAMYGIIISFELQ